MERVGEPMETYRRDALAGKRAMITGSRGIGEAIARRLAAMGAEIFLASNDEPGMKRIASDIAADGGSIDYATVDLLDPDAIAEAVGAAGRVDILVNNAAPPQGQVSLLDTDDAAWDLQLGIILKGAVPLI